MKIGYISPWETKSGVAQYTSDLINKGLSEFDVEIDVLSWNITETKKKMIVPFKKLPEIREFIKGVDVLHSQFVMGDYYPHFLPIVSLLSKSLSTPHIVTLHEHYMYEDLNITPFLNFYRSFQSNFNSGVIVHSETEYQWLPSSAQRIANVIPHGVDKLDIDRSDEDFFMIPGYITKNKDYKTSIGAFAIAMEEIPNHSLRIVGSPESESYLNELQEYSKELGVSDRVNFTPKYVPPEQFNRILGNATAAIIPQVRHASSSGTLAHVLGCRTPAIVSEAPALKEYTEDSALYFSNGNKVDLSSKLVQIVQSPELRTKMIQDFSRLASKYSWSNVGHSHLKMYRELHKSGD